MTSFPKPITSSVALVPYAPPQKNRSIQHEALEQRVTSAYQESLQAQRQDLRFAPYPLHHYKDAADGSEKTLFQTASGAFAERSEEGISSKVTGRQLVLAGALPIPEKRASFPAPYPGKMSELIATIKETVHETMDQIDYNSLAPFDKVFESGASDFQSFIQTRIDGPVKEKGGLNCVGVSQALIQELQTNHQIEGILTGQRLSGEKAFCHAVVIIPCDDGYLLLDPRSNPDNRICPIPIDEPLVKGGRVLKAERHGTTFSIQESHAEYPDDDSEYYPNIANVGDLVSKHAIMEQPFRPDVRLAIPIAAYYPNGEASKTIWISPINASIELINKTLPKGDPDRKGLISFRKIRNDPATFRDKLKQFYAKGEPTFHIPLDTLAEQIIRFSATQNIATVHRLFFDIHR